MATAAHGRTPVHLWIVGILATLWNAFGCYDFSMTNLKNETYLAQFTADQTAYMNSLPSWLTLFWAIGVWGGLIGGILLLMRSRHSVLAFGVSLVGALVAMGYEMFLTQMPESLKAGAMAAMPWVIVIVAVFLLWYSWAMEKRGILR